MWKPTVAKLICKRRIGMKNITKSATTSIVCRITSQIIGVFGANVKALTMVILPL